MSTALSSIIYILFVYNTIYPCRTRSRIPLPWLLWNTQLGKPGWKHRFHVPSELEEKHLPETEKIPFLTQHHYQAALTTTLIWKLKQIISKLPILCMDGLCCSSWQDCRQGFNHIMFRWTLLCLSLCPLPVVPSLGTTEKSLPLSSLRPSSMSLLYRGAQN